LNDCKDVKYKANQCLPFIIIKVSLNKDLTEDIDQIESCFRLPEIFLKGSF